MFFRGHGQGRRNSIPRRLILEFLEQNQDKHFSAKELYRSLLKQDTPVGIASIYRNLEFLSSLGLIKKYNFNNEASYQYNSQKSHHHLIKNGQVIDIILPDTLKSMIENFVKELESKHKIRIKNYELTLHGDSDE